MVCSPRPDQRRRRVPGDGEGRPAASAAVGGRFQQIDEGTLTEVAEKTGGEYFQADDAEALRRGPAGSAQLDRAAGQDVELTVWFALAGALLVLVAVGLAQWWNRSTPLAIAPNMTAPKPDRTG